MKRFYKEWNPREKSIALVDTAESIINEYLEDGYTLTLRQLYYQFVARDIIPNTEQSYGNLGSIITKARMAGMLDWEAIEDRNREHKAFWTEESERQVIFENPSFIRFDQWARQDTYVEVWVEKEALGNVVSRACNEFLVPHLSCKGYLSSSEAWRAGRRFLSKAREGKKCVMIHLGDHDPSGLDMTRDNDERLAMFSEYSTLIDVRRIALNLDQIDEYSPPPNPAKITDSRAKKYIKEFGGVSWELDALEPQVMSKMIQNEIKGCIDFNIWNEVKEEENEAKMNLEMLHENWDEVKMFLGNL
ncbi:hypothetical protein [Aliivibrio logei]|uniref:hypothetical protein n=1 Tax=Aliivibrio logei TaxID=688 RepID=UPI0035C911A9